jgi:hypothetical protein
VAAESGDRADTPEVPAADHAPAVPEAVPEEPADTSAGDDNGSGDYVPMSEWLDEIEA